MNGVWSCERGRCVNWVRCDTFYFELSIRHIDETAIGKLICIQTSKHTKFLIHLQCPFKRDGDGSTYYNNTVFIWCTVWCDW